ncbi:MAG: hypothetical protein QG656_2523 [Candidatus Hydrogenedentes bacterium]|nr:hypothetical protein [Candidatus Hydrogenedentota bacterium]
MWTICAIVLAPLLAESATDIPPDRNGPYNLMEGWHETAFPDPGQVRVENDSIVLDIGRDLTGIVWSNPPLRMNYEIALEAMRVEGDDFFCGLTFPVENVYCTLIVGGWHGGTVGLSSMDHEDASNNDTTQYAKFETGRWYPIRVRVTPGRIEAWIGAVKMVDADTTGRTVGIRREMESSCPMGIASWRTKAALRGIRMQAAADNAK